MSANTNPRQIARNAAANYLTLLTQLVSGLLVTPLLFHGLGQSAFGTYAFVVNLVGYVGLLELGVGTATLRMVAVRAASGKSGEVREVLGSSRALYLPVVLMTALALVPIVAYAPLLPGASGGSDAEVRLVIVALSVGQLFALLMNVYPAYIYGIGRSDVLYGVGAALNLLSSAAQAVVAITHGGIVLLAVVTAIVGALNVALVWVMARRMLGGLRARARDANRRTMGELLRYGFKNAGVTVLATTSTQSDLLILGTLLPAPRIAAYAVSQRAANFAKTVATRATDVLVPTFADAAARNDEARQFRLFVEACLFGSAVLFPMTLVVALAGKDLLRLWIGSVPTHADVVLVVLMMAAAAQVVGAVAWAFFNGRGELGVYLRTGAVVAVGNVLSSVGLTFLLGVVGPALATLGAVLAFDVLVLPKAVTQRLQRTWQELIRDLARVLGPPLALAGCAGVAVRFAVDDSSWRALGVSVGVPLVFYPALLVFAGGERRRRYARLAGVGRVA